MDPFVESGTSQWVWWTLTFHDEDNDIMTTRRRRMMMMMMMMKMKIKMRVRIIMVLMQGMMICESLVDHMGLCCISIHFDQHVGLILSNHFVIYSVSSFNRTDDVTISVNHPPTKSTGNPAVRTCVDSLPDFGGTVFS